MATSHVKTAALDRLAERILGSLTAENERKLEGSRAKIIACVRS